VTDRRQFLAGLAAVPLSAMAGDQTDTTASLASGLEVVPCPPPTPGSVTSPDGSIAGTPLTDLVDAYSQVDGVDWQHQLYSVLTNRPERWRLRSGVNGSGRRLVRTLRGGSDSPGDHLLGGCWSWLAEQLAT
jgi:hypothetical protein